MKVKLNRALLIGPSDVIPTPEGATVDVDDSRGRELIARGLASAPESADPRTEDAGGEKSARPAANKATGPAANKAARETK